MALTILEGSTFCICDERGDIADDRRLLRRGHAVALALRAHDQRPAAAAALLGPGRVLLGGVLPPQPAGRRARRRTRSSIVARALRRGRDAGADRDPERDDGAAAFELGARARLRLRGHLRGQGARLHARRPDARETAAPPAAPDWDGDRLVCFADGERHDAGAVLAGRQPRRLGVAGRSSSAAARALGARGRRAAVARGASGTHTDVRASATSWAASATRSPRWHLRVPQVHATLGRARPRVPTLGQRSRRAAHARASGDVGKLPAAGMPWFMTVFGRDTLITCLQTLIFGPELARTALRRARRRCRRPRTTRRSTPSRGRSSTRCAHGKAAEQLVRALLRHGRRDAALPRAALRGLALDGRRGARRRAEGAGARGARAGSTSRATGTATGSSSTSGAPTHGLDEQSWKDSGDSQRFHDGTIAAGADRAVRGAGLRLRREAADGRGAREAWRDRALAERLEREAAELQRAIRRGVLGRGARRLLRARARPRRSGRSTRSARTSATCSGAGSSREERVDAVVDGADGRRRSGRAGACGRCRPTTPATTRSATTTAPSGPTTTP